MSYRIAKKPELQTQKSYLTFIDIYFLLYFSMISSKEIFNTGLCLIVLLYKLLTFINIFNVYSSFYFYLLT